MCEKILNSQDLSLIKSSINDMNQILSQCDFLPFSLTNPKTQQEHSFDNEHFLEFKVVQGLFLSQDKKSLNANELTVVETLVDTLDPVNIYQVLKRGRSSIKINGISQNNDGLFSAIQLCAQLAKKQGLQELSEQLNARSIEAKERRISSFAKILKEFLLGNKYKNDTQLCYIGSDHRTGNIKAANQVNLLSIINQYSWYKVNVGTNPFTVLEQLNADFSQLKKNKIDTPKNLVVFLDGHGAIKNFSESQGEVGRQIIRFNTESEEKLIDLSKKIAEIRDRYACDVTILVNSCRAKQNPETPYKTENDVTDYGTTLLFSAGPGKISWKAGEDYRSIGSFFVLALAGARLLAPQRALQDKDFLNTAQTVHQLFNSASWIEHFRKKKGERIEGEDLTIFPEAINHAEIASRLKKALEDLNEPLKQKQSL